MDNNILLKDPNSQIEKDLFGLVESSIKQFQPDVRMELSKEHGNNSTEYPVIMIEDDGAKAMINLTNSVNRIKTGECSIEAEAENLVRSIMPQINKRNFDSVKNAALELRENPDMKKITLDVINKDLNSGMLKNYPHRSISDDLVVIPRYCLTEDLSIKITSDIVAGMGLTSKEVLEIGEANIKSEPYRVANMSAILGPALNIGDELAEELFPSRDMLVVTNHSGVRGAVGIFLKPELREEVANRLGGSSYYIVPSSVHEVLAIPADSLTPEEARAIIQDVNQNEVRPDEVLSDHPYLVDARTLSISNPLKVQEVNENIVVAKHAAHR